MCSLDVRHWQIGDHWLLHPWGARKENSSHRVSTMTCLSNRVESKLFHSTSRERDSPRSQNDVGVGKLPPAANTASSLRAPARLALFSFAFRSTVLAFTAMNLRPSARTWKKPTRSGRKDSGLRVSPVSLCGKLTLLNSKHCMHWRVVSIWFCASICVQAKLRVEGARNF